MSITEWVRIISSKSSRSTTNCFHSNMESKVRVWKPPHSVKNYAAPCESMAKSIRLESEEPKGEWDCPPPAYNSCTSSSTDGSESLRGLYSDFCFQKDNAVEDSDENQKYVSYIERLKEVIFPGSLDFKNLSPRLRYCAAYVDKELFELQRKKTKILRRQSELLYMLQDAVLEDDCTRLRNEVNEMSKIPDDKKTLKQLKREESLVLEIVNLVRKRNTVFEDMHIEKLRDIEEDEETAQVYERRKKEWMNLLTPSNNGVGPNGEEKLNSSKMKVKVRNTVNACVLL